MVISNYDNSKLYVALYESPVTQHVYTCTVYILSQRYTVRVVSSQYTCMHHD